MFANVETWNLLLVPLKIHKDFQGSFAVCMSNLSSMIRKYDMNMRISLINACTCTGHGSWDKRVIPNYVSMTLFHWIANKPLAYPSYETSTIQSRLYQSLIAESAQENVTRSYVKTSKSQQLSLVFPL